MNTKLSASGRPVVVAAEKITEEGRNNVEAMRQGLEDAGLLAKPTEQ